ncbi:hypothetical protein [Streptomyces mirabilis]
MNFVPAGRITPCRRTAPLTRPDDKPVELVDLEDTAKVLAVIEKFPVKVGGL